MHSVFTYAYALRQAQQDLCGAGSTGVCTALSAMTHSQFLDTYLKEVDFIYAARERVPSLASDQYAPYKAAKRLHFDARGDIDNPSFSVWNYNDLPTGEENSTNFKFREVGAFLGKALEGRAAAGFVQHSLADAVAYGCRPLHFFKALHLLFT